MVHAKKSLQWSLAFQYIFSLYKILSLYSSQPINNHKSDSIKSHKQTGDDFMEVSTYSGYSMIMNWSILKVQKNKLRLPIKTLAFTV